MRRFLLLLLLLASAPAAAGNADRFILLQSTTSTQNSGLLDHLIPLFRDATGIDVRVVAVGTGQALKNARNGDGDVLLVHAKPREEQFVREGYGVRRHDVMYNDFVIVGPGSDPAGVKGFKDVVAALTKIAGAGVVFASRGDESGTHIKELSLWREAGILRSGGQLAGAVGAVSGWEGFAHRVGPPSEDRFTLINMLCVARLLTTAALFREESRGTHWRRDFPERDDTRWAVHIVHQRDRSEPERILLRAPAAQEQRT